MFTYNAQASYKLSIFDGYAGPTLRIRREVAPDDNINISIIVCNPEYSVSQVKRMVEKVNAELHNNNERMWGFLTAFFAAYDICYEWKDPGELVSNQDYSDECRAWMLHALMTVTGEN